MQPSLAQIWQFYFFILPLFNDLYEKIHQTIDRVFHQDIVQKHHVISNIFCNSLLGVGYPGDDDDNRTKQKTVKHYSLLAIHLYLAHLC